QIEHDVHADHTRPALGELPQELGVNRPWEGPLLVQLDDGRLVDGHDDDVQRRLAGSAPLEELVERPMLQVLEQAELHEDDDDDGGEDTRQMLTTDIEQPQPPTADPR